MPLMYLRFFIYSAMSETLFKNWGSRKRRHTILAEVESPPLAPSKIEGGI